MSFSLKKIAVIDNLPSLGNKKDSNFRTILPFHRLTKNSPIQKVSDQVKNCVELQLTSISLNGLPSLVKANPSPIQSCTHDGSACNRQTLGGIVFGKAVALVQPNSHLLRYLFHFFHAFHIVFENFIAFDWLPNIESGLCCYDSESMNLDIIMLICSKFLLWWFFFLSIPAQYKYNVRTQLLQYCRIVDIWKTTEGRTSLSHHFATCKLLITYYIYYAQFLNVITSREAYANETVGLLYFEGSTRGKFRI